jgi:putative copper resistance protein D
MVKTEGHAACLGHYHLTRNEFSRVVEACMINPWLDTVVLWIHILAAISWVGGMIFVAFILGPHVRRTVPPEERTALMAAVGQRFSFLGWSAIFTLICTGVYNAARFLGSWDALWGTTFGHLLLVKIGLFLVMIGLSIAHDFFVGPRQRSLGGRLRQMPSSEQAAAGQVLQRLRRWTVLIAQLNLVLGVLVILLAASLQSF